MLSNESLCIRKYLKHDPTELYITRSSFYNKNRVMIIQLYWYHNYSVRFLIDYFNYGTFNGFNRFLSFYFGDYHYERCKLLGRINRGNHISRMNYQHSLEGTNPFQSINRKLDSEGNDIIAKKSKITQKLNHSNPFYHENLVFDNEGKSVIHKLGRLTILKNGTCPFSSKNRLKDENGIDIYQKKAWITRKVNNLKHYGCEYAEFSYWKRNKYNSIKNSRYYLTDDQIDFHNRKLYNICSERGKRIYANIFRRNTFISYPERLLGELLNKLGFYYKKQYPISKPTGWFYFADYYIPLLNVVVECDGMYKYINNKLRSDYIIRAKLIESQIKGRVINISEYDIYYYKSHLNELYKLLKGGNNGRHNLHS